MKDLIVAVADSYQEKVIESLLNKVPYSSGTREIHFDIIRNIGNDSGSYNDSHELLRPYINEYNYAMVIFDFEGSGIEHLKSREVAEKDVENLLSKNGWNNRNSAIVIQPEIENWMWIDSPNVHNALGWDRNESLYTWAMENGFLKEGKFKPDRPKEAMEHALKLCGTSKSSSIYKKIATNVSYKKCQDLAFIKFITKLEEWFVI